MKVTIEKKSVITDLKLDTLLLVLTSLVFLTGIFFRVNPIFAEIYTFLLVLTGCVSFVLLLHMNYNTFKFQFLREIKLKIHDWYLLFSFLSFYFYCSFHVNKLNDVVFFLKMICSVSLSFISAYLVANFLISKPGRLLTVGICVKMFNVLLISFALFLVFFVFPEEMASSDYSRSNCVATYVFIASGLSVILLNVSQAFFFSIVGIFVCILFHSRAAMLSILVMLALQFLFFYLKSNTVKYLVVFGFLVSCCTLFVCYLNITNWVPSIGTYHFMGKHITSGRVGLWTQVINQAHDFFYFGEHLSKEPLFYHGKYLSTHNAYLSIYLKTGFVGLLLLLNLLLVLIARVWSNNRVLSYVLGFCFLNMFEVCMFYNNVPSQLVFWFCIFSFCFLSSRDSLYANESVRQCRV